MRRSTVKVTKEVKVKEAKNFAFFALIDNDNLIECHDPCHCFVPIDEVADPDTLNTFIEVYSDELEPEEMPVQKPVYEIFEFQEVDICGNCDGRIMVASINAETGLILFQKEVETKINHVDEMIYDEDPEDYNLKPFQRQMTVLDLHSWRHRKGENYKPCRNNRKTLLDRKIQRESRPILREIKLTSSEEDNFYEENFFIINDALEFDREDDNYFLGALA